MASTCLPHLPDELFIQVLQSVDDPFVLWVTCRQVSQAWRKEGERALQAIYLPLLCIDWSHIRYSGEPGGRIDFNFIATADEHSIDPQSSTLSLLLRSGKPQSGELSSHWEDVVDCETLERDAGWIRTWNDRELWGRHDGFFKHAQAMWFDTADGRYTFVGSAETRTFKLQFPAQEQDGRASCRVTCDWKALMDALFTEERYVRHKRPGPSFFELGEQGIRAHLAKAEQGIITMITAPDTESSEKAIAAERKRYKENVKTFLQTHCHQNEQYKSLYVAALQERLYRVWIRDGTDPYAGLSHTSFAQFCDSNNRLNYDQEQTGCGRMMQSRLDRLQAFADGIWEKRFGRQEELTSQKGRV
ncbi:hypothetical protein BKA58DRAFT_200992 [Alternaria rosae]|uniref:uncharacterized protein n=1 Tax=Alternaria rosae TaxID=1187941 RepID=UPI001E8CDD7F|nr:uncharacterized protein BKA58DRAFT_200992 [Alternaria rosae]KAH6868780.1 hypothetical protein BKA58DRAFT_200992 [Alternaria rosae]